MSRKKILWLPSWYPNKTAPFNGDFIKRHAEAVSLYEDIQVIYVVRDLKGIVTKDVHTEEFKENGLTEKIIYYYLRPSSFSFADKYFSERKYRKLYKQAVEDFIQQSGLPDLTHVHVGMKAGPIALWMKKKNAVPYVVSEHWTGLLSSANESFERMPFYFKILWKNVMKSGSAYSAVSKYLANAIKDKFDLEVVKVIPNVVDSLIFYPDEISQQQVEFIHVSSLQEFKNPVEIIRAFSIVHKQYPDSSLKIFGPENKEIEQLVTTLSLENNIVFYRETSQRTLADHIRNSLALILYSSYETFGCVIIEANACGIPVIISDIPVFYETVTEHVNGFFVQPKNPEALANKMLELVKRQTSLDKKMIADESEKYSYQKIGKQFSQWYKEILKNN